MNCLPRLMPGIKHKLMISAAIGFWLAFQHFVLQSNGAEWEHLIRSVRRVLMSLNNEQNMDEETQRTLISEVEWVFNSWPRKKVTNHLRDLDVLAPDHLLLFKYTNCFSPGVFDYKDEYTRRRWRQVNHLANVLCARWRSEYVVMLQKRQKWHFKI